MKSTSRNGMVFFWAEPRIAVSGVSHRLGSFRRNGLLEAESWEKLKLSSAIRDGQSVEPPSDITAQALVDQPPVAPGNWYSLGARRGGKPKFCDLKSGVVHVIS